MTGDSAEIIDEMEKHYVLPHEFLYLVANSEDRLPIINQNHKVELKSEKMRVYHWETKYKRDDQEVYSHISLLPKNAFENQAPN